MTRKEAEELAKQLAIAKALPKCMLTGKTVGQLECLPLIEAYGSGKDIEVLDSVHGWRPLYHPNSDADPSKYRIAQPVAANPPSTEPKSKCKPERNEERRRFALAIYSNWSITAEAAVRRADELIAELDKE